MILGLLLVSILVLSAAGYFLALRPNRWSLGRKTFWHLAYLIGTVRIGAIWLGATGLRSPGAAQGVGYLVLMLDLPEIYVVRSLRSNPQEWVIAGSVLLAATSFVWARLLIWAASGLQLRPKS